MWQLSKVLFWYIIALTAILLMPSWCIGYVCLKTYPLPIYEKYLVETTLILCFSPLVLHLISEIRIWIKVSTLEYQLNRRENSITGEVVSNLLSILESKMDDDKFKATLIELAKQSA